MLFSACVLGYSKHEDSRRNPAPSPAVASSELRTPVLGPQVQEVHQADVKVHNREGGCIGCGLVGHGIRNQAPWYAATAVGRA